MLTVVLKVVVLHGAGIPWYSIERSGWYDIEVVVSRGRELHRVVFYHGIARSTIE